MSEDHNSIDHNQKITWELYKYELDTICTKSKAIKVALLRKARIYTILSILINYPVKLLLGVTVGGGAVQLFNESTIYWITVLRIVFEISALILTITRDFFMFETQIEKFYSASHAVDTFYNSVKYESYLRRGNEGDRYEVLLMYKKLYEEMVSNNKIIQTVETISPATPPDERLTRQTDMDSAPSNDEENPPEPVDNRRVSLTADRNRVFYMHSLLERMPH